MSDCCLTPNEHFFQLYQEQVTFDDGDVSFIREQVTFDDGDVSFIREQVTFDEMMMMSILD